MLRKARDFIVLFNKFWYRDFPLSESYKLIGSRAEWTTHIGVCVRSTSDLMGYFTYFEQGNRTDAIIKDNLGKHIAHIEWEWTQAYNEKVNEIRKLYKSRKETEYSVFISYSREDNHLKNIKFIEKQWGTVKEPLVVILLKFYRESNTRIFQNLETYLFRKGKVRKIRSQPALPWELKGSRWETNSSNSLED